MSQVKCRNRRCSTFLSPFLLWLLWIKSLLPLPLLLELLSVRTRESLPSFQYAGYNCSAQAKNANHHILTAAMWLVAEPSACCRYRLESSEVQQTSRWFIAAVSNYTLYLNSLQWHSIHWTWNLHTPVANLSQKSSRKFLLFRNRKNIESLVTGFRLILFS